MKTQRIVTIGKKVNGKYKAKEEMSLKQFMDMCQDVITDITQPVKPYYELSWFDTMFETKKYEHNVFQDEKRKRLILLTEYKTMIGYKIQQIIDKDKPGKKVLKR